MIIVNYYWSDLAFLRRHLNLSQITGWCFLALWATWWETQSSAERTRPVSISSISLHQSPVGSGPVSWLWGAGTPSSCVFLETFLCPPNKLDMHTLILQHLSWGWQKSTCNMSFSLAAEILKPPVFRWNSCSPESPQIAHFQIWTYTPRPALFLRSFLQDYPSSRHATADWHCCFLCYGRSLLRWTEHQIVHRADDLLPSSEPYLENFGDISVYLRHAFAVVEVVAAHWDSQTLVRPNTGQRTAMRALSLARLPLQHGLLRHSTRSKLGTKLWG